MNNNPIGIFDSGVGGLSVWREIVKELPRESTCYYADSINCPYGLKSQEEIISLSKRIVDFLLSKKCKLIVVACNSATAAAIDFLREQYDILFVGMEPATKIAASKTKTGSIGVLATEQTFNGRHFAETSNKYLQDIEVQVQVGNGLVEMVESGKIDTEESLELIKKYLKPMIEKKIDQLVLGCTHYPFLIEQIKEFLPDNVNIINPADAVARHTRTQLKNNSLLASIENLPVYEFYTSGDTEVLKNLIGKDNMKFSKIILHNIISS